MNSSAAPDTASAVAGAMVSCPNCMTRNLATNRVCTSCGTGLGSGTAARSAQRTPTVGEFPGTDSAAALRVVAWLNLIASGIAAFVLWDTLGTIQVPSVSGFSVSVTEAPNPIAGWMAVAVLAQGIIGCILFHAVAAAAENTAEIRRTLAIMAGEVR